MPAREKDRGRSTVKAGRRDGWLGAWEWLVQQGFGEPALRIGTGVISILLFLVVIWVMSTFYVHGPDLVPPAAAFSGGQATPTPSFYPTVSQNVSGTSPSAGISRLAQIHTDRPVGTGFEIIRYTVQAGDTVFGIADRFNLTPQTILWGNLNILADNPEWLTPGQVLNILPVDGVLYQWRAGDGLNGVAKFFGVSPDDIIDWPGNHLTRASLGSLSAPNIPLNTNLVIPGGRRDFTSWDAERVVRTDPAAGKGIGAGACLTPASGTSGTGSYVWPTGDHAVTGYGYSPEMNHPAVDIGSKPGSPILAADSGVVVFAGASSQGYGSLVIVDHGNGWQSLYARLSAVNVYCGQSVNKGAQIGALGAAGKSAVPYLHFELRSDTLGKVNPLDYLPKG